MEKRRPTKEERLLASMVSVDGLKAVLGKASEELSNSRFYRERSHIFDNRSSARTGLRDQAHDSYRAVRSIVSTLDKVLPRPDGSSWMEEIEAQADNAKKK